jgi:hypothetical protein
LFVFILMFFCFLIIFSFIYLVLRIKTINFKTKDEDDFQNDLFVNETTDEDNHEVVDNKFEMDSIVEENVD